MWETGLFTDFSEHPQTDPFQLIRLYLLKPPVMVSLLWQIAKHILDAKTHSRIVFLQRPEELFTHLRAEAIPEVYGGLRRDDTGFCLAPETCVSEPQRITPQLYFNLDEWWQRESGGNKVRQSSKVPELALNQ
jgi:hypothetical protein